MLPEIVVAVSAEFTSDPEILQRRQRSHPLAVAGAVMVELPPGTVNIVEKGLIRHNTLSYEG